MKKTVLLFGVFLSLLISGSHASTDGLHVNNYNLTDKANRIALHLRCCKKISEDDIKGVFSTLRGSSDNSSTSSDEEGKAGVEPPKAKTTSSLVDDFIEVTEYIATDRSRQMKEEIDSLIDSLNDFARKVRVLEKENDPLIVECVLNTIVGQY